MKARREPDELIQKFMRLFPCSPFSVAFRYGAAAAPGADGKIKAEYLTESGTDSKPRLLTAADVRGHFSGRRALVLKPVLPDKSVLWAALDFDKRGADFLAQLSERILEHNLPLHAFASKSPGSAHAFCFFQAPVLAANARALLASWAQRMGYDVPEIYPKQDQTDSANKGNGLEVPFFNDPQACAAFTPTLYAHAADGMTTKTEPPGLLIPPGLVLREVLERKLRFEMHADGTRVYFSYHGLVGPGGNPQPCLIRGTVHDDHGRNVRQCSFVQQGDRFWHTCFSEGCRDGWFLLDGAQAELATEDFPSKTRRALLALDALVPGRSVYEELCGDAAPAQVATAADWPEPEELAEDLPAVPAFRLDFLPECFRPLVEDVSERMQTPMDMAAAAAIVALAGCVGRRARIQPKAADTGWVVLPNLWGAVVAPPGFLKSPVLQAITAPLQHVEEMWRQELFAERAAYESEREKKELAHAAWKESYKAALKKGAPLPPEPDVTLVEPARRRLLVGDATPEKLQELLVDNPAGVLVLRDELVGLVAEMDKEGRESQRTFFLQGWNGYGSFTVDRIGRGHIHIPHVCLSVFGNIQPARLRPYLAQALEGGLADDGLLQRFQIFVWPDTPGTWRLIDTAPDGRALACAEKVFSRLANLPTESVWLQFTTEAQAVFYEWWRGLEEKVRADSGLHPALVTHLAKYRSLLPTLAGLFELADTVANGQLDERHGINDVHARQAVALCSYLESHARRIYSSLVTPERHAVRELGRHIQRGALTDGFTAREIYRKDWAGLDERRVPWALKGVEEAGWVRRVKAAPSPAGGRPTEHWQINPKVLQGRGK